MTKSDCNELAEIIYKYSNTRSWEDYIGVSLPDPNTLLYYKNKEARMIWLFGEIDAATIDLVSVIIEYNKEDEGIEIEKRRPILLYINSPGGLLVESLAISDAILNSQTPVHGIVVGECSSGATIVYSACHKRFAYPSASFLLHQGSGGTGGTYVQTKAQQKHYDNLISIMTDKYLAAFNLPSREWLTKKMENEWYLYASETNPESEENPHRYGIITNPLEEIL